MIAKYTFDSSIENTLPVIKAGYTYEYTDVDNGDGTITRTITSDTVPEFMKFTNKTGLLSLDYFDITNITDMFDMFSGCTNLRSVNTEGWNTRNVTNMQSMFESCIELSSIDLSNFNTSNVNNMFGMFWNCKKLTSLDLSSFDTSNVLTMGYMFYECNNLKSLDLSSFDTSKVTSMSWMFASCNNLTSIDLSNWVITKNNETGRMFNYTDNLTHIKMFNSDVNSINYLIGALRSNNHYNSIDVGNIDLSLLKVKEANKKNWGIYNYYYGRYTFDNTIEDVAPTFNDEFEYEFIDTVEGNITTRCINGHNDKLYNISFRDSMGLLEVEYINTKGFESLNSMFRNCKNLEKIDLSRFNIDDVIDFNSMFYLCKNLSEVNMAGLEPEVVNKYIEWLPNRKSPLSGIIMLDDITDIDIAAANDKSWEIVNSIIVKYVFDSNIEEDVNPNVDAANTAKLIFLNKKDNICTKALVLCDEEAVAPILLDFANSKGLIEIKKIECEGLLQLTDMFFKCSNLTKVRFDSGGYTFSDATNMFYGCESLTELDFSKFETHYNVTTARNMFAGCTNLKNVTGLSQIFYSNLIDASYMFKDCVSLTSIDMNYVYISYEVMGMFEGCTNLVEIKNFNYIQDVLIAVNMFKDCKSLTDISFACQFYEETVATDMFAGCDKLERVHLDKVDSFTANRIIDVLPVVGENSHHVLVTGDTIIDEEAAAAKNWENRCYYLYNIVITESGNTPTVSFDTTSEHNQLVKYKKMPDNTYESACYADLLPTRYQFSGLSTKLLSVSYICTDNVNNMYNMFYNCQGLVSADLSKSNTSKVTDMRNVFQNCITLTELDLSNWNTSNVTNMEFMFHQCRAVTSINVSGWSTSKVTSMNSMFKECEKLISIEGISSFNPKLVTNMNMMFYQCNKLLNLDLSNWDTGNVTGMGSMFRYCRQLTELDLSNWNTSNVTRMANMFEYCNNLTSLDLSNFNTSNVTDMKYMFKDCYKLESVKLNNFRWTNISNGCFSGCSKLREVDATNISTNSLEYLIESLPSRTVNSLGIIRTGNCNYTEENYNAANAKNWIIEPNADVTGLKRTIAKYTFNSDTDTLPRFNEGYVYIYTDVDNGDGTITRTITSNSLPSRITFSSETGLIGLSYLNTDNVTNMENMFWNCSSLTSLDVSSFNTSNVINMYSMFSGCKKLTTIEGLSSFNTSNVTNMNQMFWTCANLTSLDVSSFDTSNVTNMCDMFRYCEKLSSLDLSNFDTSKVTTMKDMFYNCKALTSLDISNFDTSKVTDMSGMFNKCSKLSLIRANNLSPSTINAVIGQLPTVSSPNYGILKIGKTDITDVDTTTANNKLWFVNGLKIAEYEFSGDLTPTFNEGFEYKAITNNNNKAIISNGIRPSDISFEDKIGLVNLSYLDTSDVTDMNNMFYGCSNLTSLDLSSFDTSKVTSMGNMFRNCDKLTSLDLSNFDTSKVTNMNYVFIGCNNLTSLDLSSFDTSKVTNMSYMFYDCSKLTSLDLSNFDTSKVTDMGCTFSGCSSLASLDVSSFDTSNVTDMSSMFYGCSKLTSLDLSSFSTNIVTGMSYMFSNCTNLTSLDLSSFNTNKAANITNIFDNSNNIKIIRLDNSDMNTINTIISLLPTRNSIGKLYITNVNDVSGIDKATAASKKWKIVVKENTINTFIPINLGGKSIRAIYTNNESYL